MGPVLKIVVVEDHHELLAVTVSALTSMGHDTRGVDCAEALDDELAAFSPDILVLDLNLPGEDGLSLARRMRAADPDIGIIMVTAREQLADKLKGYRHGADLYLTKPTSPEELGAAIEALSRRIRPPIQDVAQLRLTPLTLQLSGSLGAMDISDQDCLLLTAFSKAPEHRLETWQMLELSGKTADEAAKRALEVQIVRLRKKLEQVGASGPTIKSIRGSGYQLCVSIEIRRGSSSS